MKTILNGKEYNILLNDKSIIQFEFECDNGRITKERFIYIRPFDTIDELIEYVKRHIKADLSLRYTTKTFHIQYLCNHPKYGYCIVCSELIDGMWTDGYYIFNGDSLQRQCDAR